MQRYIIIWSRPKRYKLYCYIGIYGCVGLRSRLLGEGGRVGRRRVHDGNHNNVVNQRFYLHVNAKGSRRRPAGVRATKEQLGRGARRFSANLTSFRAGNRSSTHIPL